MVSGLSKVKRRSRESENRALKTDSGDLDCLLFLEISSLTSFWVYLPMRFQSHYWKF